MVLITTFYLEVCKCLDGKELKEGSCVWVSELPLVIELLNETLKS
jgi:hypothetical protein